MVVDFAAVSTFLSELGQPARTFGLQMYTELFMDDRAGRLVLDLGLHLDPSPLIEQGFLSPFDGYVRRVTFWGVWTVDKEFGAVLGRPGTLTDLSTTTCPRPPYWREDDFVSYLAWTCTE